MDLKEFLWLYIHMIFQDVCKSDFLAIFAARNATVCRDVSECGEIWLLATT